MSQILRNALKGIQCSAQGCQKTKTRITGWKLGLVGWEGDKRKGGRRLKSKERGLLPCAGVGVDVGKEVACLFLNTIRGCQQGASVGAQGGHLWVSNGAIGGCPKGACQWLWAGGVATRASWRAAKNFCSESCCALLCAAGCSPGQEVRAGFRRQDCVCLRSCKGIAGPGHPECWLIPQGPDSALLPTWLTTWCCRRSPPGP